MPTAKYASLATRTCPCPASRLPVLTHSRIRQLWFWVQWREKLRAVLLHTKPHRGSPFQLPVPSSTRVMSCIFVHQLSALIYLSADRHGVKDQRRSHLRLDGNMTFCADTEVCRLEAEIEPVGVGSCRERRLSTDLSVCTVSAQCSHCVFTVSDQARASALLHPLPARRE